MTRRAHRTHDARRRPAARMEYNARRGRPGVDKKWTVVSLRRPEAPLSR
ncbi:hypothetical protein C7S16_7272 [Burkholderia thailandensis]|uniref:Uncharacterized protein n=1 Tax=Burkholderia thailandensis TaxID=57975 RepID=A0AAW9CLD3_BURTH|nr:hypothetical protein [Burkholderia thailandensis]